MPGMLRLSRIFLFSLALGILPSLAAQAPATPASLIGSWEGELVRGRDNSNLAFTFGKSGDSYTVAITSSALGVYSMPAESVSVDGLDVKIKIAKLDLEFYGTIRLAADGSTVTRIDGDYYQQSEMVPVVLLAVPSPTL